MIVAVPVLFPYPLFSYDVFVLSLYVLTFFSLLCLGKAVLRDCSISWVYYDNIIM